MLKRAERDFEIKRLAGLVFVSEDCPGPFSRQFPERPRADARDPERPRHGRVVRRRPERQVILSVGRALDDKGHREAMGATPRARHRRDWSARFIVSAIDREPETVRALRNSAAPFGERVRIDANLPYAEVKNAWAKAAIGMALTKPGAVRAHGAGGARERGGAGDFRPWRPRRSLRPRCADRGSHGRGGGCERFSSLIDSEDLRQKLAHAGRARVEALYDMPVVARRMDDFFDEVLARRG